MFSPAGMRAAVICAAALAVSANARATSLHLTDQTGRQFSVSSLQKPAIVTFVSMHCADVCPIINGQFALLQQRIASSKLNVSLVTVTLDPEKDTLLDMRRTAQQFRADPRLWKFVGGDPHEIHALMRRFAVSAVRGKRGYADQHTTFVYLLDRRGNLRRTMLASTNLTSAVFGELFHDWVALDR